MLNPHIKRLSHVGVDTSDLEASVKWYTEVLGLEVAFRLYNPEGKLWIVYLHATPNTFIELFAPRPNQAAPAKAHFALQVDDIEAAVADLKQRLPPESLRKPDIGSGKDGSRLFNFYDPDGHRIEFMEFPPESQQAQAMKRMGM
jgi:lactoylglutathione lyase